MDVERLAWAGIKVTAGDTVVAIDALGDAAPLEEYMGPPAHEVGMVAEAGTLTAALVTHVHPDHYDPRTLQQCLEAGAEVVCPMTMRERVAADGLRPSILGPGDTTTIGGLHVAAVRAVDGLGEEQVSWVVSGAGGRILHGGDTLWHGYWWQVAEEHGPIDVAFLPINGAIVPWPTQTDIPASLTPDQAVAAGLALGAGLVAPIHYGTFNFAPRYVEFPDAEETFLASAAQRGMAVRVLAQGETFGVGPSREQDGAAERSGRTNVAGTG